jgi:hypothetical protein
MFSKFSNALAYITVHPTPDGAQVQEILRRSRLEPENIQNYCISNLMSVDVSRLIFIL